MNRILLAMTPELFREAFRDCIEKHDDLEVVGEVTDPVDLLVAYGKTGADVVIHMWPDADTMPEIFSHLFAEYPHARVIGVTPRGNRFVLCEQTITTTTIPGDLRTLLSAIRLKVNPVRTRVSDVSKYSDCNN